MDITMQPYKKQIELKKKSVRITKEISIRPKRFKTDRFQTYNPLHRRDS